MSVLGLKKVGHFTQVGYKFGRWLDLTFMQLVLKTPAQPEEGVILKQISNDDNNNISTTKCTGYYGKFGGAFIPETAPNAEEAAIKIPLDIIYEPCFPKKNIRHYYTIMWAGLHRCIMPNA